ncbi:MAG: AAA family ATPase [Alphaproteobacteria bacterium]
MSEAVNQGTSILLPAASVAVYSRDVETLEAARNLVNDWRFARVQIQVEEGDAITATNAYKELSSPDVVIVQTDTIEEPFIKKLEDLGSQCSEGTAAIVVGPVNDVSLYRRIIGMGISDYLVRPVKTEILADVIAKTLIQSIGVSGSRLIAFVGAKGGVGASTLAQATAWGVSDILGQKTMLIDSAGGWSTTSVGMGFEPSTTLAEAARAASNKDEDSIKRMLFRASDKLSVLASGGDVMLEAPLQPEQLEELLTMLMVTYPVVIADLSHASENMVNTVVAKASQIIVVSTPTLTSLRLARSLIQEIKEHRGGDDKSIEMIINMQGMSAKSEVPKKDIEQAMEFKVSTSLPFDPTVFGALETQSRKFVTDSKSGDIVRKNLLPLVQKIISATAAEPEAGKDKSGFLGGILGKAKAKG